MFRIVLSIILVVAFAGASAASVVHGVNHGSDHAGHHAEPTTKDVLAEAEMALAECCDTTSGMGSTPCFGDLVATSAMSPVTPAVSTTIGLFHAGSKFSNHARAAPTGPPKA